MEPGIILYQSKYGATRRYAMWLRERTGYTLMETKAATPSITNQHRCLVLCGGIYASGIAGIQYLKRNRAELSNQHLIILAVGASPDSPELHQQLSQRHLQDKLKGASLFYARGSWNEEGMSFLDRKLCQLLQKAVARKDPANLELWEQALMASAGQAADWTAPENLEPLIDHLRALGLIEA